MAEELAQQPLDSVTIHVGGLLEQRRAIDFARRLSRSLGFTSAECEEIVLVVTELATNVIRHASGGSIKLCAMHDQGGRGIRIESEDSGPGIPDVEKAIADGYSTAGGLGIGLGTVNRLMDDLEIYSAPPCGAHIICHRWVRPARGLSRKLLSFGVATRSYRRQPENGDAFIIKQWESSALAGVIDGLGHGQYAQRASQTARQYIEQHFDQSLEGLFRGAGRACRATRGVVMALARFDLTQQKVSLASVGNIEVRLIGSQDRFNLIVRRGIIGLNAPQPVVGEYAWTSDTLLIMHSDGLNAHWDWHQFRELARETPSIIAQHLLQTLGKIEDDATVIVARNTKHEPAG